MTDHTLKILTVAKGKAVAMETYGMIMNKFYQKYLLFLFYFGLK